LPDKNSRLVYSTDGEHVVGRSALRGRAPSPSTLDAKSRSGSGRPGKGTTKQAQPPADGIVRIQRTSRGHGGKTVTVITGLPGGERDLDELLKVLKQHCGAGGTREASTLVIQGDHRERLRAKLEALGHQVKLAGG
jgi:translation initiation factor 1